MCSSDLRTAMHGASACCYLSNHSNLDQSDGCCYSFICYPAALADSSEFSPPLHDQVPSPTTLGHTGASLTPAPHPPDAQIKEDKGKRQRKIQSRAGPARPLYVWCGVFLFNVVGFFLNLWETTRHMGHSPLAHIKPHKKFIAQCSSR